VRHRYRHIPLLCLLHLAAAVLLARVAYLQLYQQESLEEHGDARALRVMEVPAIRGMITDRHGEPLAISTPVHSIWATPRELLAAEDEGLARLAQLLNTEPAALRRRLQERIRKDFVYLHRGAEPDFGARVMALGLPGVSVQREYRRYYPAGEVTAQLLGFTDIDDRGQEGIELRHDDRLRGRRGVKRVLRDRLGQTVKNIETVRAAVPGRDLTLAIDRRLQYLAHRELKTAVAQRRAAAGTLVLDLAAASGGNCELTRPGERYRHNGVEIWGPLNMAAEMAPQASDLYARNLERLLQLLVRDGRLAPDWEDEIVAAACIARDGELRLPEMGQNTPKTAEREEKDS